MDNLLYILEIIVVAIVGITFCFELLNWLVKFIQDMRERGIEPIWDLFEVAIPFLVVFVGISGKIKIAYGTLVFLFWLAAFVASCQVMRWLRGEWSIKKKYEIIAQSPSDETAEKKNERQKREEAEAKKLQSAETGKPITLSGYKVDHPNADPTKRFIYKEDAAAYLKSLQEKSG